MDNIDNNNYKIPAKKIIAAIIFFIMLLLLCGFSDGYVCCDADDATFIFQSLICLAVMLGALVFGRLYEDIPDDFDDSDDD